MKQRNLSLVKRIFSIALLALLIPTTAYAKETVGEGTTYTDSKSIIIYNVYSVSVRFTIEDTEGHKYVIDGIKEVENTIEGVNYSTIIPPGENWSSLYSISLPPKTYTLSLSHESSTDSGMAIGIEYGNKRVDIHKLNNDDELTILFDEESDALSVIGIKSVTSGCSYDIDTNYEENTVSFSAVVRNNDLSVDWSADNITVEGAESYTLRQLVFDVEPSVIYVNGEAFTISLPKANAIFEDVAEGSSYFDSVYDVYQNGWMIGTSENTFSPEESITRGMFVTVLHRVNRPSTITIRHSFADVSSDAYYNNAVSWAYLQGIVKGYSATIFGPDDPLTREQLITLLIRYTDFIGADLVSDLDVETSDYSDFEKVSDYAKDAMTRAIKCGLITGSWTQLDPQKEASRAEVAMLLTRLSAFL